MDFIFEKLWDFVLIFITLRIAYIYNILSNEIIFLRTRDNVFKKNILILGDVFSTFNENQIDACNKLLHVLHTLKIYKSYPEGWLYALPNIGQIGVKIKENEAFYSNLYESINNQIYQSSVIKIIDIKDIVKVGLNGNFHNINYNLFYFMWYVLKEEIISFLAYTFPLLVFVYYLIHDFNMI
jgi:hypothetical protein